MDFIIKTDSQDDSKFINLILNCIFDSAQLDIQSFNVNSKFTISVLGLDNCDFFIDLSYYSNLEEYNAFQIYFIQYLSKAIFGEQLDPRPILEDLKNRVASGDINTTKQAVTPTPTVTPKATAIFTPEATSILDNPQPTPGPTSSRLF